MTGATGSVPSGNTGTPSQSAGFACVYVTDRAYLPVTCFSIASLAAKLSAEVPIHLLHVGVDQRDADTARRFLEAAGVGAHVAPLAPEALAGLPPAGTLPMASYGRLLIDRILPASYRRVLYLDGDTLIDRDVTALASVPLDGKAVGAVVDIGRLLAGRVEEARRRLELGPDGAYFNSGVLLIDRERWRRKAIGEACLRVLAETPERFTQKDQCALNFVCRGDWARLDVGWNLQPAAMLFAPREGAVYHFLGGNKPWRTGHLRYPMSVVERYERLFAASPWANEFRPPRLPYAVLDGLRAMKLAIAPRVIRERHRFAFVSGMLKS